MASHTQYEAILFMPAAHRFVSLLFWAASHQQAYHRLVHEVPGCQVLVLQRWISASLINPQASPCSPAGRVRQSVVQSPPDGDIQVQGFKALCGTWHRARPGRGRSS